MPANWSVCAISEGLEHALRLQISPSRLDLQVPLMTLDVGSKGVPKVLPEAPSPEMHTRRSQPRNQSCPSDLVWQANWSNVPTCRYADILIPHRHIVPRATCCLPTATLARLVGYNISHGLPVSGLYRRVTDGRRGRMQSCSGLGHGGRLPGGRAASAGMCEELSSGRAEIWFTRKLCWLVNIVSPSVAPASHGWEPTDLKQTVSHQRTRKACVQLRGVLVSPVGVEEVVWNSS